MYQIKEVNENSNAVSVGPYFKEHVILKGHQTRIIHNILENERLGENVQILAEKLGAGKTFIAMGVISHGVTLPTYNPYIPFSTEYCKQPDFIPWNVIICTYSMVKHWEAHFKQHTTLNYYTINSITQLLNLLNLRKMAKFDKRVQDIQVLIMSSSLFKVSNDVYDDLPLIARADGCPKNGENSMNLVNSIFDYPVFARVIYDDFNDLKHVKNSDTLIGQSMIYISSTYDKARNRISDNAEDDFGHYNNIFKYAYLYNREGNNKRIQVHKSNNVFYDKIVRMPTFEVKSYIFRMTQTEKKMFSDLRKEDPEMAERLAAYAVDIASSSGGDNDLGYFMATMLMLPKLKYDESAKRAKILRENIFKNNPDFEFHVPRANGGYDTYTEDSWIIEKNILICRENNIKDISADLDCELIRAYNPDKLTYMQEYKRNMVRAKNQIQRNKEQICGEECPICALDMIDEDEFDENPNAEFIYTYNCCGCTICNHCNSDHKYNTCPNCSTRNPSYFKINYVNMDTIRETTDDTSALDKYDGKVKEKDIKVFANKFSLVLDIIKQNIRNYENVTVEDMEVSHLIRHVTGLCVGKVFIPPPANKKKTAIITSDMNTANSLYRKISEENIPVTQMNCHNAHYLDAGDDVIIISTNSLRAGINLPSITDLIIMHKYVDNAVFSQALGRFQRVTRQYSMTVHQLYLDGE